MSEKLPVRPISVKPFRGYQANRQKYGYRIVERLIPYITRCVWSPIVFADGTRIGSNFTESHWCVLDFDNTLHIEQAVHDFCDYQNLIVTTKSHTEHYHAFRVIIPWQEVVTDADDYKHTMRKLTRVLGSDNSCTDWARFYWPSLGGVYSFQTEGDLMVCETAPDVIQKSATPPISSPDVMPTWLKEELSIVFAYGQRRKRLYIAGCQLRRAGYDRETAVAIGTTTIKLAEPLSENEITKHIEAGWEGQNQKP